MIFTWAVGSCNYTYTYKITFHPTSAGPFCTCQSQRRRCGLSTVCVYECISMYVILQWMITLSLSLCLSDYLCLSSCLSVFLSLSVSAEIRNGNLKAILGLFFSLSRYKQQQQQQQSTSQTHFAHTAHTHTASSHGTQASAAQIHQAQAEMQSRYVMVPVTSCS